MTYVQTNYACASKLVSSISVNYNKFVNYLQLMVKLKRTRTEI